MEISKVIGLISFLITKGPMNLGPRAGQFKVHCKEPHHVSNIQNWTPFLPFVLIFLCNLSVPFAWYPGESVNFSWMKINL